MSSTYIESNTKDEVVGEGTGFTLRVVVIGLAMLFVMSVLSYEMRSLGYFFGISFEPIAHAFNFVYAPNMAAIVPMMLIIVIINPILLRLRKKFMFSTKELVLINVIAGIGGLAIQLTYSLMLYAPVVLTANAIYNGTGIWSDAGILEDLSPLAFINNPKFVLLIGKGGNPVEWRIWFVPLLTWFFFLGTAFFVNMCMAVLVRRRWTEREHLTFPVAKFQLALIKGKTGFEDSNGNAQSIWSNKLLWLGFIIGGLWCFPHTFSRFFPGVPSISNEALSKLTDNFIGHNEILKTAIGFGKPAIYPLLLGFLWYVPLEMLFSIWFFSSLSFWIFVVLLKSGATWSGLLVGDLYKQLEVLRLTGLGATVALSLIYLWNQRIELKTIITGIFSRSDLDDKDESMSYRTAVLGAILGTVFLVFFANMILKVSLVWALLYILIVVAGSLAVGRIRADSGAVHQGIVGHEFLGTYFPKAFGNRFFSYNTLRGMGLMNMISFSAVVATPATLLEGWRMGDEVGVPRKTVKKAFYFAIAAGYVIVTLYSLPLLYKHGRDLLVGAGHFGTWIGPSSVWPHVLLDRSRTEIASQFSYVLWPVISAIVVFVLGYLRSTYVWWPLHPVGWAVGFTRYNAWFKTGAIFIWCIKFVVYRYGGMQLFKKLTPIFIGIALSEIAQAFLYIILIGLKLARVI
jgi:hypothetical protein